MGIATLRLLLLVEGFTPFHTDARCSPALQTPFLCRLPLTRPEMALGLLVEVAYEHDEEFRQHLPQVLHMRCSKLH